MSTTALRRSARGLCLVAAVVALAACDDGDDRLFLPTDGDGVVDSIAVEPPTARIEEIGQIQPFVATAFNAAGDTVDADLSWASSDLGVATMNQDGVATAVGPGQTDITASVAEVSGRAVLTVALVAEP